MSIFSKIGGFFKNLFSKKDKEEEVNPVCEDESVTSSETEATEPVTVVETDTLEEKEAEVCEPEQPAEETPEFAAADNISVVAKEELEPEPVVEDDKEEPVDPVEEFKSFVPIDEDDRAAILEIIRPVVKKANASEAYLAYIKDHDMEKKNFKCYSAMTDDQQLVIRLTQSASYNEKLADFVETLVPEIADGFKDLSMNIVLNVSSNNGFIFVRKFAAD